MLARARVVGLVTGEGRARAECDFAWISFWPPCLHSLGMLQLVQQLHPAPELGRRNGEPVPNIAVNLVVLWHQPPPPAPRPSRSTHVVDDLDSPLLCESEPRVETLGWVARIAPAILLHRLS